MSFANANELKNALTSVLQPYNFSEALMNQLLSDDFINGAFELIKNEPENDEFMNFARSFSEEQNLISLMDAKDKILNELKKDGYLTSIIQYVIDSWRNIDFSAGMLMRTNNRYSKASSPNPKSILDVFLKIAGFSCLIKYPAAEANI